MTAPAAARGSASPKRTRGFAAFIVRHRLAVIALWAVVIALALPRAAAVQDVLHVEGSSVRDSESRRAAALIRQAFARPFSSFFAVTLSGPFPIDSAAHLAIVDSLTRRALAEPYISGVVSYLDTPDTALVSADRRRSFFIAAVRPDSGISATDVVPVFRRAMHETLARISWARGFRLAVTGGPALDYDVRTVSREDADLGERRALPFTAVVLVLAFGALVAAVLPVGVGMTAISVALAVVAVIGRSYPMSVFVLTIISMVGLGVGIDYSLFVVTRFREELNRGRGVREAAERTIATAGRAVLTSGLTVMLGFGSLLITPLSETRSVGIGGLVVVFAAVLLAVTLLPAVLSLAGRGVDWPRWLARRLAWYHAPTGWERWSRWLGHHPWRAVLIAGGAVAVVTWPLAQIKIGLPREGWFPSNTESHEGAQVLETIGAPGVIQPVRVVVQAPSGARIVGSRYIRGLRRLSDSLRADPRVADVRSVVDLEPNMSALRYVMLYADMAAARARAPDFYAAYLSPDDRTTLMDVLLADTTSLTGSMDVVRRIRSMTQPGFPGLDSVEIVVGGFQAASVDLQDKLLGQFPLVVILVLASTALMLFVAFRSVLVPLKAVVMNCLSVAAAFGVTVLVFQEGVGARLLGLQGPTEAVYVVVPILVFATVFGLSMDYEIFLLSRIKEAFDRTGRNDQATMEGLTATASVITSAAAVMMIVFGIFSFSRVLAVQMLGFGLAVAVFLDATLVRMVLVPAIMHIAGRWNWWPGVATTAADSAQAREPPEQ